MALKNPTQKTINLPYYKGLRKGGQSLLEFLLSENYLLLILCFTCIALSIWIRIYVYCSF